MSKIDHIRHIPCIDIDRKDEWGHPDIGIHHPIVTLQFIQSRFGWSGDVRLGWDAIPECDLAEQGEVRGVPDRRPAVPLLIINRSSIEQMPQPSPS